MGLRPLLDALRSTRRPTSGTNGPSRWSSEILQRQRELDRAADAYLAGDITSNDFERRERALGPDMTAVLREIGERRVTSRSSNAHVEELAHST